MSDLKFKLVKSEQEVTTLEQNVTFGCFGSDDMLFMSLWEGLMMFVTQVIRLEAQVTRYKSAAENAEKVEDELKVEKRKLQREVKFYVFIFIDAFLSGNKCFISNFEFGNTFQ